MISPQTSVNVLAGRGTSVEHVPAMAYGEPARDADLRETLAAHELAPTFL